MWKDNFIMGSLVGKSLYRIKFDDDFNKVFFIENLDQSLIEKNKSHFKVIIKDFRSIIIDKKH